MSKWSDLKDDIWVRWYLTKGAVKDNWLFYLCGIIVSLAMVIVMWSIFNIVFSLFPELVKFLF
jgi:hypothetical protein